MKRVAFVFWFCGVAFASTEDADAQKDRVDCNNPITNIEIGACLDRDLKAADTELNRVYQIARDTIERSDHLPPDLKAEWKVALRDAQRLWISYRDADCRALIKYEWWGGSGTSIAVLSCLLEKTQNRVSELRARYDPR